MIINLKRFAYLEKCTRGELHIMDETFQTIERPWVPFDASPGGTPFKSCIPDGNYIIHSHLRPSGQKVYIISNAEKGVYEQAADRDNFKGRYLILIHPGNTVDDVVGCIAPGMNGGAQIVTSSRDAMAKIVQLLGDEEHILQISPKGAV